MTVSVDQARQQHRVAQIAHLGTGWRGARRVAEADDAACRDGDGVRMAVA